MGKLSGGRPPLFRGRRKSRSDEEAKRMDCMNANVITEARAPTNATSKVKSTMIKPLSFLKKRSKSTASSAAENSFVLPCTPVSSEDASTKAQAPSNAHAKFVGVCGQVAAETIAIPDPPQEDDRIGKLQKQLSELQNQVKNLNEELDYVYNEKDDAVSDAVSRLDKLLNSRKKNAVARTELEEIRMILTAEGDDTVFSDATLPFYGRLCYPCAEV